MSKLIMMRGLPGSGKSTKAKEIVESGGNFVRINRDLLREMLHLNKFNYRNEGLTIDAEKALAREYLVKDINVVIDDCNLSDNNRTMWKAVADKFGAKFEVIDLTNVHPYECIANDLDRKIHGGRNVGNNVIMNMALQYELYKPKKGFVLCDLDGTLCDITHRLEFIKGEGKKDWKSFFEGIPNDKLRLDVFKMLCRYKEEGYDIVFISARPQDYEKETVEWIDKHVGSLEYETVIMRRSGDRRPDTEVKQEILNKYFKDKSLIYKVIDDRPSVIRMWKENGLDVIDVGDGVEF